MNSYYPEIIKALKSAGYWRIDGGKGSHEKWTNDKHTQIVPPSCKSRYTAKAIMKDCGINKRF